jgi:hypothetical protein
MSKGVIVRLLVPTRSPDGKIVYQAEQRFVRLPVKREDRLAFLKRLAGDEDDEE